jgi:hypothetical protein
MPEEPAGLAGRQARQIDLALLGIAVVAGVVAVVAGFWLVLGGVARGSLQHRGPWRVVGVGSITAGELCLGWAAHRSWWGPEGRLLRWCCRWQAACWSP